jgi:hypothetical protein
MGIKIILPPEKGSHTIDLDIDLDPAMKAEFFKIFNFLLDLWNPVLHKSLTQIDIEIFNKLISLIIHVYIHYSTLPSGATLA